MISTGFKKNGEIIDYKAVGNDIFLGVNTSSFRIPIINYNHIRFTNRKFEVINEDLGYRIDINEEDKLAILRNSENGYYLYSIEEGKRLSSFFEDMSFVDYEGNKLIYSKETIRNCTGNNSITLSLLIDKDGTFLSDILNVTILFNLIIKH